MPVEKAKGGKRWGKHGKVYRGKGAVAKAKKQGIAVLISQGKIHPKGGPNKHKGKDVKESNEEDRGHDVLEFTKDVKKHRVDREKGIIYGCKILGFTSDNDDGIYPKDVVEAAKQMYEGVMCNLNHPPRDRPGMERAVDDRFGIFRNVVIGDDGAYADLHVLKSHPFASRAFDAAESMPEVFGFSHNARTIQVPNGKGGVIHETILRVRSVDLVTDPATTNSIFESKNNMDETENTQETGSVDGAETSVESDPVDSSIDALLVKYLPKIKEADKAGRKPLIKELTRKMDAIIAALADEEDEEEEDGAEDEKEEEKNVEEEAEDGGAGEATESEEKCSTVTESKKTEKKEVKRGSDDSLKAIDVLESAGVAITKERLSLLLSHPADQRETLAKSWKESGKQPTVKPKPKSSSILESSREEEKKKETPVAITEDTLKRDAALLMSGRLT